VIVGIAVGSRRTGSNWPAQSLRWTATTQYVGATGSVTDVAPPQSPAEHARHTRVGSTASRFHSAQARDVLACGPGQCTCRTIYWRRASGSSHHILRSSRTTKFARSDARAIWVQMAQRRQRLHEAQGVLVS